jgi:sulfur carrier protein
MKVRLNGLEISLSQASTLAQFLSEQKLELDVVVVEYNGEIISKAKLAAIVLADQDEIEVLRFVGGG